MRALVGQLLQMGEAAQQAAATAAADAAAARAAAFAASPAAPSQPALLPHNPPSHDLATSVGMAAAHSTVAAAVFNALAALVSLARLAAMCVVNVLTRTPILTSSGQAATPSSPATPELHKAIGSPPDLPAPSPSLSPPAILCTAPDVSQPRALHKDLLAEISSAGGSPMRLRSGSNGSSFKSKPSPLGSLRSGAEPNIVEVLDRKKLAEDNRKLAESAGQMLHTLILDGSGDVKKIIISSIISTVQQPGSVPPEDVPALMVRCTCRCYPARKSVHLLSAAPLAVACRRPSCALLPRSSCHS